MNVKLLLLSSDACAPLGPIDGTINRDRKKINLNYFEQIW